MVRKSDSVVLDPDCTKNVDKNPDYFEDYLQKTRNSTKCGSIEKDTPVIAKLSLSFQISLNWIFKLAVPTVTAQLLAFVVLKVVFTDKREPSNIRLPHFPLFRIGEMWLICIFSIHLHSVFNSP